MLSVKPVLLQFTLVKPLRRSISPMASGATRWLLAERLVTACDQGDLPCAKAAVADGGSVNVKNRLGVLPLEKAVLKRDRGIVVWLLSLGADPNGGRVMASSARHGSADVLQLLIDAGGDVCCVSRYPALEHAVSSSDPDKVRVLLAVPTLDVTEAHLGRAPEQYARDEGKSALADEIAQEVSSGVLW